MVKTAGSGQPVVTFEVQISSTLPDVKARQPVRAALLLGRTRQRASKETLARTALGRSSEQSASSTELREALRVCGPFPSPLLRAHGHPNASARGWKAGSRNTRCLARAWTGRSGAGTSLQPHS